MAAVSPSCSTDSVVSVAAVTIKRPTSLLHVGWLLALVVLAMNIEQTTGSGMFELRVGPFRNRLALTESGECCARWSRDPDSGSCGAPCRTFLRVCLSHYQLVIPDNPDCTHDVTETQVLQPGRNQDAWTSAGILDAVAFPFSGALPDSFTLIVEAWHDWTDQGPTQGSPRSLIWRLAVSQHLNVSSVWTARSYQPNITSTSSVTYQYRFVCDVGYYDNDCTRYCAAKDNSFGHYTCDERGQRVCNDGWTGEFCQTAICSEGCRGTCTRPFQCRCRAGWQGARCDECVVSPSCQHGYCVDRPDSQCICLPGWTGQYCDQELDYCARHKPCRHGGVCTNAGPGWYSCHCRPGFTGTNCERDTHDCRLHAGCLNAGTCQAVANGNRTRHVCLCPTGYTGSRCEWSASSDCRRTACHNSGSCVRQAAPLESYQCICQAGYSGQRCEINIDECASEPCLHGGRCIDAVNSYRCHCPHGRTGARCDVIADYCRLSVGGPCLNGGTCVSSLPGSAAPFTCRCPPTHAGPLCQCRHGYGGMDCTRHITYSSTDAISTSAPSYDLVSVSVTSSSTSSDVIDVDDVGQSSLSSGSVQQTIIIITSVTSFVLLSAVIVTTLAIVARRRCKRKPGNDVIVIPKNNNVSAAASKAVDKLMVLECRVELPDDVRVKNVLQS